MSLLSLRIKINILLKIGAVNQLFIFLTTDKSAFVGADQHTNVILLIFTRLWSQKKLVATCKTFDSKITNEDDFTENSNGLG